MTFPGDELLIYPTPSQVATEDRLTALEARATALEALVGSYVHLDDLDENVSGFTNTAYADLDALTTAFFTRGVSVSLLTGTDVMVILSAHTMSALVSGTVNMGYRVSGATTVAPVDSSSIRVFFANGSQPASVAYRHVGLTPGVNVFELQAKVSANTAQIIHPSIAVIPLP